MDNFSERYQVGGFYVVAQWSAIEWWKLQFWWSRTGRNKSPSESLRRERTQVENLNELHSPSASKRLLDEKAAVPEIRSQCTFFSEYFFCVLFFKCQSILWSVCGACPKISNFSLLLEIFSQPLHL